MISIEQCRAARGLLDWTQQNLADASGLSKTAINNFEKGHSDIKAESLRAIRLAFETADIEFLDNQGVAKKTESTKILRGKSSLNELVEDMHETLKQKGKEILISFIDQEITKKITAQKLLKHFEFLKTHQIKQRILSFSQTNLILSLDDECRWLNENNINIGTTTFIYGDKVAHQLWDQSIIIITRSADAVKAERGRFETIWQSAPIQKP